MNKTSPLVLALLFSGASALRSRQDSTIAGSATPSTTVAGSATASTTDGTTAAPHFDEDELDAQDQHRFTEQMMNEANEIMSQNDQEMNLVEKSFRVMADDSFNAYANGIPLKSGDNWEETYMFDAVINDGVDTVAFELNDKKWGGNFIATIGEHFTNPDEWVCKDVPDDGQLPDGWNMNDFDDSTWAKAFSIGQNNRGNSPFRGWTSRDFPEDAHYMWSADEHSNHVMCRWNQLPFEERAQHHGMCQDEMMAFERIVNQLISHHQNREEHWRQVRRDLRMVIAQISGQNEALQRTKREMGEQMEANAKAHAEAVEHLDNEIIKTHDHYAQKMITLENRLNGECAANLHLTVEGLNADWTQTLKKTTEAHEQSKRDLEEAHRLAMQNQADDHRENLENTVDDLNDKHKEHLDNTVEDLNNHHSQKLENRVNELTEQFEGEMLDLEKRLHDEHQDNLADELEKLRQEMSQAFAREMHQKNEEWQNLLASTIEDATRRFNDQNEVMGAEIDRLTRKHDYLYESCTTVQVVDGELVIN